MNIYHFNARARIARALGYRSADQSSVVDGCVMSWAGLGRRNATLTHRLLSNQAGRIWSVAGVAKGARA